MKLLIVHGYEPSGHATVARALEACAKARGLDALRVNISADYHPVLGPAVARGYLALISRAPRLWDLVYDNPLVARAANLWRGVYGGLAGGRLEGRLADIAPDAVVCTSAPPMAAILEARARLRARWPVAAVITDYRAHRYWLEPRADLYLTATTDAADALVARGVSRASVRATGIPLHPAFAESPDAAEARHELGLIGGAPVVLVSGGSRGLGGVEEAVDALVKSLPTARLLVLCGSNKALYDRLRVRSRSISAFPILEPTRMRRLMAAADLLVGKAGGVTCAEALAAGLPMVIFHPLPGQEAGNAEFLLSREAVALARSPAELGAVVEDLLLSGGIESLRRRSKALGRPDSGAQAIDAILALRP